MSVSGGLYAMTSGEPTMLKWYAGSLDSLHWVSLWILQFAVTTQTQRWTWLSTSGALARTNAYFGRGTGIILLDNVGCIGGESRLLDCSNSGIGVYSSNCDHGDDAGVICNGNVVHVMIHMHTWLGWTFYYLDFRETHWMQWWFHSTERRCSCISRYGGDMCWRHMGNSLWPQLGWQWCNCSLQAAGLPLPRWVHDTGRPSNRILKLNFYQHIKVQLHTPMPYMALEVAQSG